MSQRPPARATSSVAHATRLSRPWRLTLLVAIIAGLVLVTWQAARLAREQALSSLTDEAHNELRLSAEGLRGHLSRHDYLAEMLASREVVHRFLATPDKLEAMPVNRLLDKVRETADVSDIYLLNRQGDPLAASNWQRPDTFIGQNYRFRDYYQDAVAGRLGRFGLLLRMDSKLVLLCTSNLPALGHILSRIPHVIAVERIPQSVPDHGVDQFRVPHLLAAAQMDTMRCAAHALLTAGDDDRGISNGDRL